jgi:hypothetical protein
MAYGKKAWRFYLALRTSRLQGRHILPPFLSDHAQECAKLRSRSWLASVVCTGKKSLNRRRFGCVETVLTCYRIDAHSGVRLHG